MTILFYHVVPSKMRDFTVPLGHLPLAYMPAGAITTIGRSAVLWNLKMLPLLQFVPSLISVSELWNIPADPKSSKCKLLCGWPSMGTSACSKFEAKSDNIVISKLLQTSSFTPMIIVPTSSVLSLESGFLKWVRVHTAMQQAREAQLLYS